MLRSKSAWLLILWLVAAVGCLILLKVTGLLNHLDLDLLSNWLREIGWLGGVLYMVVFTLRPLVLFPVTPITLYGGFVFGAFWGCIYYIIGAGAGAILSFYIARKWGRGIVEKLIKGEKLQSFVDRAEKSGFTVVLYMRLVPIFPFDGISYVAGLSKVRARDYILATMIGIIPGAVVYNVFGASFHDFGSSGFYWAVAMYVAFAALPLVLRRMRKRKEM